MVSELEAGWCVAPPYSPAWLLWLSGCVFIRRRTERLEGSYMLHLGLGLGLQLTQSVLTRSRTALAPMASWEKHTSHSQVDGTA